MDADISAQISSEHQQPAIAGDPTVFTVNVEDTVFYPPSFVLIGVGKAAKRYRQYLENGLKTALENTASKSTAAEHQRAWHWMQQLTYLALAMTNCKEVRYVCSYRQIGDWVTDTLASFVHENREILVHLAPYYNVTLGSIDALNQENEVRW